MKYGGWSLQLKSFNKLIFYSCETFAALLIIALGANNTVISLVEGCMPLSTNESIIE